VEMESSNGYEFGDPTVAALQENQLPISTKQKPLRVLPRNGGAK
jgi:hypothetical protein